MNANPHLPRRGLQPNDAPWMFVPAPRFALTGGFYLAYLAGLSVNLLLYTFFAGLVGLFMTVVASILGPLGLLSAALTLAVAIGILAFGIPVSVYAFKGRIAGVYLALGHCVVSLVLFAVLIPAVALAIPAEPVSGHQPPAVDDAFIAGITISFSMHCMPILAALFDIRRARKYRKAEKHGSALTYRDLVDVGLAADPSLRKDADPPQPQPPSRELEFPDGKPNAFGAHRRN